MPITAEILLRAKVVSEEQVDRICEVFQESEQAWLNSLAEANIIADEKYNKLPWWKRLLFSRSQWVMNHR